MPLVLQIIDPLYTILSVVLLLCDPVDELCDLCEDAGRAAGDAARARAPRDHAAQLIFPVAAAAGEGAAGVAVARRLARGQRADHGAAVNLG